MNPRDFKLVFRNDALGEVWELYSKIRFLHSE